MGARPAAAAWLATLTLALVLALAACGYSDPYANSGQVATARSGLPSPTAAAPGGSCNDLQGHAAVRYPDGLQVADLVVGTGATVKSGDALQVTYTGYLQSNCSIFDSTLKEGGKPFSVTIGQGQVIKGWDEGIPGMKVGGTRKLIIPAALGYGAQGSPPAIPGNATLVFDVSVVSDHLPTPSPSPRASPPAVIAPSPTPT